MASLMCTQCRKSLIEHILKQETLMRSILETFVEDGYVCFDLLVDRLISAGVLQTKHHKLLTVAMDTGHCARRVWNLLLRSPPGEFKEHVEPLLEELGFLQHRKSVNSKSQMCLRCVMEHMLPVEELADKLVTQGCLKVAQYRDAVEPYVLELWKWPLIFESLRRNRTDSAVVKICEEMLKEFGIPAPEDLAKILAEGVPCACGVPIDKPSWADPSERPIGPFCGECEPIAVNYALGEMRRRPSVPRDKTLPVDLFQPDDVTVDDVEMRPRSCRNLRKNRMSMAHSFQRHILEHKNEKRVSG